MAAQGERRPGPGPEACETAEAGECRRAGGRAREGPAQPLTLAAACARHPACALWAGGGARAGGECGAAPTAGGACGQSGGGRAGAVGGKGV